MMYDNSKQLVRYLTKYSVTLVTKKRVKRLEGSIFIKTSKNFYIIIYIKFMTNQSLVSRVILIKFCNWKGYLISLDSTSTIFRILFTITEIFSVIYLLKKNCGTMNLNQYYFVNDRKKIANWIIKPYAAVILYK